MSVPGPALTKEPPSTLPSIKESMLNTPRMLFCQMTIEPGLLPLRSAGSIPTPVTGIGILFAPTFGVTRIIPTLPVVHSKTCAGSIEPHARIVDGGPRRGSACTEHVENLIIMTPTRHGSAIQYRIITITRRSRSDWIIGHLRNAHYYTIGNPGNVIQPNRAIGRIKGCGSSSSKRPLLAVVVVVMLAVAACKPGDPDRKRWWARCCRPGRQIEWCRRLL